MTTDPEKRARIEHVANRVIREGTKAYSRWPEPLRSGVYRTWCNRRGDVLRVLGLAKEPVVVDVVHSKALGMLVSNLLSLEFLLRVVLSERLDPKGGPDVDPWNLTVGDKVPEIFFTNYLTLGQLIEKFNSKVAADAASRIDRSVVELRDALAHGRVWGKGRDFRRLLKFSPPERGMVEVTFSEELTLEWFDKNIRLVSREIAKLAGLTTAVELGQ